VRPTLIRFLQPGGPLAPDWLQLQNSRAVVNSQVFQSSEPTDPVESKRHRHTPKAATIPPPQKPAPQSTSKKSCNRPHRNDPDYGRLGVRHRTPGPMSWALGPQKTAGGVGPGCTPLSQLSYLLDAVELRSFSREPASKRRSLSGECQVVRLLWLRAHFHAAGACRQEKHG